VIRVPKTGGSLSLIPILAGLSALDTLCGGVANIVRTIRGIRSGNQSPKHLGKGMYFSPHKGAGSYAIIKKSNGRGSRKRAAGGKSKMASRKKADTSTKKRKISMNKKNNNNNKSRKMRAARKSSKTKN